MIVAKLLELRDRGTFIPILALRVQDGMQLDAERYLLGRAGYGTTHAQQQGYVWFAQINGGNGQCSYSPADWNRRTYGVAHEYVLREWYNLSDGDVIDVEYILGETATPKTAERLAAMEV